MSLVDGEMGEVMVMLFELVCMDGVCTLLPWDVSTLHCFTNGRMILHLYIPSCPDMFCAPSEKIFHYINKLY